MTKRRVEGRMIRKSISRSRKIGSLSPKALSLFCMLIPHYNAHGKINGDPYFIKGEILPQVPWATIPSIKNMLREIHKKTDVKWFKHKGLWYLHDQVFYDVQNVREDRRGNDNLPSFPDASVDKSVTDQNGKDNKQLHGASMEHPNILPHEVEVEVEVEVEEEVEVEVEGEDNISAAAPDHRKIIACLNEVAGKNFLPTTSSTINLINARYKQGFTYDDFVYVIEIKTEEWKDDPKMAKFIRPQTLFGSNFESYRNQVRVEQRDRYQGIRDFLAESEEEVEENGEEEET